MFTGDVALRHRSLFNRPHGFTRDAIENKSKALLRQLYDGVDLSATDSHRDDARCGRRVVIPQPVMRNLEVPLLLTGRRVETDDGFAVQILSRPARTKVVIARRTDREIHESARFVE